MNFFRLTLLLCFVTFLSTIQTSCKKTVTRTIIDTVLTRSVDTVFVMNARSWNYYNYTLSNLVDSGQSTYFTTFEGLKFVGQGFRLGGRLQTKSEVGFVNKVVYFKWKPNGNGQFAAFVPQIKYDALSFDNTPAHQGVDFGVYTVNGIVSGSVQIPDNAWYYTRIIPQPGTDIFQIVTATNNYNNLGGTVVSTKTMPIYTKSGYISLRMGDNYAGTSASAVIGECKISSN